MSSGHGNLQAAAAWLAGAEDAVKVAGLLRLSECAVYGASRPCSWRRWTSSMVTSRSLHSRCTVERSRMFW